MGSDLETGLCKVIAEALNGRILGVHMLGAHAAKLIHEAALTMQVEAALTKGSGMNHAHFTMAEGFVGAVEDAEGKSIHQIRSKVG